MDRGRRTVGREHHHRSLGHLVELVDEDSALVLQSPHHVKVVDDLFADVHGSPVLLESSLDRVDRALDTGAIPTRSCQKDRTHPFIVPSADALSVHDSSPGPPDRPEWAPI
jgi:hypothetical protein